MLYGGFRFHSSSAPMARDLIRDHLKRSHVISDEDDRVFAELRSQARVAVFLAGAGLILLGALLGAGLAWLIG